MRNIRLDPRVQTLLIALVVLWVATSATLSALDFPIIRLFNFAFTMRRLIIAGVIVWLTTQLPSPFREGILILATLWFVYTFTIFGGFTWLVLLILVIFLLFYIVGLLGGRR